MPILGDKRVNNALRKNDRAEKISSLLAVTRRDRKIYKNMMGNSHAAEIERVSP